MFGLFKSITEIVEDVATIALSPVEVLVEIVKKPLDLASDAAKEIVQDIKDWIK